MKLEISVPSKTFLVGEYLVLKGGPALLLNSTPRFKLIVEQSNSREVECLNFGNNTAVENFLEQNPYLFDYLSLKFIDPYKGLGGFGASSALYLLITLLKNYLMKCSNDPFKLLNDYMSYTIRKLGYVPCESEIISQFFGGITLYHKKTFTMKRFEWAFPNLTFCLVNTDLKINTAQHLQKLPHINFTQLEHYVFTSINALISRDSITFCKAINRFGAQLHKHGLVSPHINNLLQKITQHQFVLAAKGCGALGSDVICVILQRNHKDEFITWLNEQNLYLMGADNFSHDGISFCQLNDDKTSDEVILVDINDQQIGTEDKLIAHKKALLHRAFSIFIFRKKGTSLEILLQQRADDKYHCGGLWSNTCCSHPSPGEDSAVAAKKRLQHEMGFSCPLTEVAVFRYVANVGNGLKEHEIDHVFVGEYKDDEIKPNENEVKDFRWVSLHDLIVDLKANPKKYTPWLSMALNKLLSKKVFYKK